MFCFWFVIAFNIDLISPILGGPGGQKLPPKLWGAKRPPGWKVNVGRRSPNIDEIKADFEIYNKPKFRCSVKCFRFSVFELRFVLGPGGLREARGGPGKAHG